MSSSNPEITNISESSGLLGGLDSVFTRAFSTADEADSSLIDISALPSYWNISYVMHEEIESLEINTNLGQNDETPNTRIKFLFYRHNLQSENWEESKISDLDMMEGFEDRKSCREEVRYRAKMSLSLADGREIGMPMQTPWGERTLEDMEIFEDGLALFFGKPGAQETPVLLLETDNPLADFLLKGSMLDKLS